MPERGPSCWTCRHFAITYIPATPYRCRLMGFQSEALPALVVLRSSGQFCRGFAAKAAPAAPLRRHSQ